MKPFNLKKALAGHPLVTRDGRKVVKFGKASPIIGRYYYAAIVKCERRNTKETFSEDGEFCVGGSDWDLFLATSLAPSKPRQKSETRKNVERVKKIMGRDWLTLETIETRLVARHGVCLPEQSISARVRDLRKDEFGGYDIRKKAIGKGLFAYKNFGKKGAVKG